jgi:hypothetical protein
MEEGKRSLEKRRIRIRKAKKTLKMDIALERIAITK